MPGEAAYAAKLPPTGLKGCRSFDLYTAYQKTFEESILIFDAFSSFVIDLVSQMIFFRSNMIKSAKNLKILGRKAVKIVKRKVFEESQLILEPEVAFAERLAKWCEAKRKKKVELDLSNDYVAEKTKVSQATIGRIMSGSMDKDIRWSTVIAVDRLLPTEKPVSTSAEITALIAAFEKENAKVREDASREIELYKDKIASLEAQIVELKTLVTTRGRILEKVVDKLHRPE